MTEVNTLIVNAMLCLEDMNISYKCIDKWWFMLMYLYNIMVLKFPTPCNTLKSSIAVITFNQSNEIYHVHKISQLSAPT